MAKTKQPLKEKESSVTQWLMIGLIALVLLFGVGNLAYRYYLRSQITTYQAINRYTDDLSFKESPDSFFSDYEQSGDKPLYLILYKHTCLHCHKLEPTITKTVKAQVQQGRAEYLAVDLNHQVDSNIQNLVNQATSGGYISTPSILKIKNNNGSLTVVDKYTYHFKANNQKLITRFLENN